LSITLRNFAGLSDPLQMLPTSHHLAFAVQYITLSGVLLLCCVAHGHQAGLVEGVIVDTEKCVELRRRSGMAQDVTGVTSSGMNQRAKQNLRSSELDRHVHTAEERVDSGWK